MSIDIPATGVIEGACRYLAWPAFVERGASCHISKEGNRFKIEMPIGCVRWGTWSGQTGLYLMRIFRVILKYGH